MADYDVHPGDLARLANTYILSAQYLGNPLHIRGRFHSAGGDGTAPTEHFGNTPGCQALAAAADKATESMIGAEQAIAGVFDVDADGLFQSAIAFAQADRASANTVTTVYKPLEAGS